MNSQTNHRNAQTPQSGPGLGLDDIYFTAFRHKKIILVCICIGLVGAGVVRLVQKSVYSSHAKLFVRYILDRPEINPNDQDARVINPGGASVLTAETEILTSLDVAKKVAEVIGPERILAKKGGGSNLMAAAGVISGGVGALAHVRAGDIMLVYFEHPDPSVVQPVLEAVIEEYLQKHKEVRTDMPLSEGYYSERLVELRKKLASTEEELKRTLTAAKVLDIAEAKRTYSSQIEKLKNDLLSAKADLYARKASLGEDFSVATTNDITVATIPSEKLENYATLLAGLEELRKRERQYLIQNYKEEHPQVVSTRQSIADLKNRKTRLEEEYPGLALGDAGTGAVDRTVELAQIRALTSKILGYENLLTNLQNEALDLLTIEPAIRELTRRQAEEAKELDFVSSSLDKARQEGLGGSKVTGINVVEKPTPPVRSNGKTKKIMLAVFGGFAGLGFAIAAFMDFVIDRTIKRSVDVRRHLRLPFMIAIPDSCWDPRLRRPRLPFTKPPSGGHAEISSANGAVTNVTPPWDPTHHLRSYTEGLRERLIVHFEVNGINHKPKLVGVTSCGEGAGVTTLASGVAAALSKTGDGNVLLVDMTGDSSATHTFYKGKPGCGLVDALEPEGRAEAQVQENLYVCSLPHSENGENENATYGRLLPSRFNKIMPELKASDYDYIIFDMPPVTPTSMTPRLASTMDMVLLVLESEKTFQQTAALAGSLLSDAKANTAVVLNKCRKHVPALLSQEL